jgi:hypothetical protein
MGRLLIDRPFNGSTAIARVRRRTKSDAPIPLERAVFPSSRMLIVRRHLNDRCGRA